MKRQWHLRRQFRISEDDDRQRDQAYQHLLQWPPSCERHAGPASFLRLPPKEEEYEDGHL